MKKIIYCILIIFIFLLTLSSVSAHGADITDDTMIIANESNGVLAKSVVDDLGLNITVYKFKSDGDVEHQLEHALSNPNKRILAIAYQDTVENYLNNHSELKNRVLISNDDSSSLSDSAKKLVEIDIDSTDSSTNFITPLIVGLVIGLLVGVVVGFVILKNKK
ncbi:hypothetical protein [Methanobrevibacter olleyae]|uniref:Uncharacterized protein n=1 Tax=Methanobrevibacter olleyae TaxID=294671 RepID=A0A126R2F6_METOL|nr:hypothetical protein [Methanobrevibacter olleyae]AMK16226.1 hypothetical protein YLM1_1671 [Methanobrevibacter olleyae]SFL60730.1 hypothetical protein SAMN02910297_01317 [Methanobrevibacter olleyae]